MRFSAYFIVCISLPVVTSTNAQTPAQLVESLPLLDGARLTAFQSQLTGRTQRALHELNKKRISDVEKLLTLHNMCFREIAKREVSAAYVRIERELSDLERSEVIKYLQTADAHNMLAFEEGSVSRMTISPSSPVLDRLTPNVERFHSRVRQQLRAITLSSPGPACQVAMKAEFQRSGLAFAPERQD